jgi:hypothetical protein
MTFKNPEFSSSSPYFDDFDDAKNFLKILFKPGYAVQARELTQLQTILQSQLAKFADSIFQDGSQVFGGKIQIVSNPYARVEKYTHSASGVSTNSADTYLNTLPSNLLKVFSKSGSIFTELATIKISYFEPSNYSVNDDYPVAFYNTVSVAPEQAGTFDIQRSHYIGLSSSGPFLKVINPAEQAGTPTQYTIAPYGEGYLVTVDDGIFYIDGYFVKSTKQTVALFKKSAEDESEITVDTGLDYNFANKGVRLFAKPSHRIGYTVNRETITATQDSTLKDPARGFYNYNAPGGDRYSINFTLKAIEYDNSSVDIENYVNTDFIQLLRTTRGVVDYIKDKSSYSQILDLFARRTQDESGSYTVVPFIADVKNHLRNDKYVLTIADASVPEVFASNVGQAANVLVSVGGYIWPATQSNFNPFSATNLNDSAFAVAKVVDIVVDHNEETGQNTAKLVVELQNNKKLSSIGTSYYFKQSAGSTNKLLLVSSVEVLIDPKGAYSRLDVPVGSSDKLAITLQSGKAYVFGYEYETFAPRVVEYVNSGNQTSIKPLSGLNVDFELGNYVYGSFAQRNANQSIDVDFEKLPLLDLIDVNTNTILLYPTTGGQQKSKILAWAPFKNNEEFKLVNEANIIDINKLTEADVDALFPHESVLFVEEISSPA